MVALKGRNHMVVEASESEATAGITEDTVAISVDLLAQLCDFVRHLLSTLTQLFQFSSVP